MYQEFFNLEMEKESASNPEPKTGRSNRDLKRAAITEQLQTNPTEFLLKLQDDFDELQKKFGEGTEHSVALRLTYL